MSNCIARCVNVCMVAITVAAAADAVAPAGRPVREPPQFVKTIPSNEHTYWVVVLKHVDGDTVRLGLVVDIGNCRLAGIDTPERGDEPGYTDARFRLMDLLPFQKMVECRFNGRGKYGRPIVVFPKGDTTVNQIMLDEGLARKYPNT